MPLYEHKSGERVLTAPESPYDAEMAAKANDPGSGWSRVEAPTPKAPKASLVRTPREENVSTGG